MLSRGRRLVQEQLDDLPVLALVHCVILGFGVVAGKMLAARVAFGEANLLRQSEAALRALGDDLLMVGALTLLAALSRSLPRAWPSVRLPLAAGIMLTTQFCLAATFINVEFFGSWASTLTWELLRLAPNLAGYILLVGVSNSNGALTIWAVLAIASLLLAPGGFAWLRPAVVRGGRWHPAVWALALAPCLVGSVLMSLPQRDHRESTLRRLSLPAMLVPGWLSVDDVEAAELGPGDLERLHELTGSPSDAGARALAPLRGRRLNVVVWVWESVSARYLRSLHSMGVAEVPNLERIAASGSVSFSQSYAECPLTVQSTWALMTGMSPPAKPFVFVESEQLPKQHGVLHGELGRAGYRTGGFYASYTVMWRTHRVFELAPFDVFEDADSPALAQRYARNGIGVQDEAPVERALEWLSRLDRDAPFFALLWNTETHRPYTWAGMPPEMAAASEYERYLALLLRGDALFGQFYEGLRRAGHLEDTLVVVTGDHGEGHRRSGRPWHVSHGSQVFEDDVHVPLLFLHPSLGTVEVDTLNTQADLFPTLLDVLGLPVPENLDGRSLARPYPGKPVFMRGSLWWPIALRAGRYKLILNAPGAAPSLFDLVADPGESHDVLAAEPEIARLLTSALYRWHSERFRSDPTFGFQMPSLRRLVGRPFESLDWSAKPTPSVSPEHPPSRER